jgi:hypothetical protein
MSLSTPADDAPSPDPIPAMARSLRFAVATDMPLARWQALCIEGLADVAGVTLERWVRVPRQHGPGAGRDGAAAMAVSPVPQVLRDLTPEDRARGAAAAAASGGLVDVLLDLSAGGITVSDSRAAEVWRFRYGTVCLEDPASAALLDYIRNPGRTQVTLGAEPGDRIIRKGWLSWWRGEQLDRILLDTSAWPALAALDRLDPDPGDETETPAGRPTRRAARGAGVPRPVLRVAAMARRGLSMGSTFTRHDDWQIGFVDAPIESVVASDGELPITWLAGRPGRFAADPFGLERDGALHVFFEDYDQHRARGTISHVEIAADGTPGAPEPVLDPGVHTSYPFLIEDQGSIFLLPETSAAGKLVLYEALDFPRRWRPATTMLDDIPAVDASVIEYGGAWWMFATRSDRGPNHNLFIWHAPRLTGPWTAHARNPVKTDARSARPGGTPFWSEGRLYRPSQDDSHGYGGRVVVNEVEVLTPSAFVERPVRWIEPPRDSAYPDGLHTLAGAGTRTLIDGNRRHFVKETFQRDVAARLGHRLIVR